MELPNETLRINRTLQGNREKQQYKQTRAIEKSSNISRRENEKKNVGKRCEKKQLHKPGGKVFIRLRGNGKDSLKKQRVLIGRILKPYKVNATHLVKVKIPGETEPSVHKFRIANIADNSRLPQKNQSNQGKRKKVPKFFSYPLNKDRSY